MVHMYICITKLYATCVLDSISVSIIRTSRTSLLMGHALAYKDGDWPNRWRWVVLLRCSTDWYSTFSFIRLWHSRTTQGAKVYFCTLVVALCFFYFGYFWFLWGNTQRTPLMILPLLNLIFRRSQSVNWWLYPRVVHPSLELVTVGHVLHVYF